MRIKTKLFISYISIALVSVLLLSVALYFRTKFTLEKEQISKLNTIVNIKVEAIEKYFSDIKTDISIIQKFWNIQKNFSILVRNENESETTVTERTTESLDRQLIAYAEDRKILDFMLISPEGRIIYCSNGQHRGMEIGKYIPLYSLDNMDKWKKDIWFSNVFNYDGIEEIMTVAPLFSSNENKLLGFVAIELNMKQIYGILEERRSGLGKTGEAIIGRKEGDEVLFISPLLKQKKIPLSVKVSQQSHFAIPMIEAVEGRNGSGLSIDYTGEKVVAVWKYIPSLDWGIVAKIDTQEAFAAVSHFENDVFLFSFTATIISLVLAVFMSRSITRPIYKLREDTRIIKTGNLNHKIDILSKDEIGELALSFDDMVFNLNRITASRDELNEKEQRLRFALDSIEAGEWDLNLIDRKAYRSLQHDRIFGYEVLLPEWSYDIFIRHVVKEDKEMVDQKFNDSIKNKENWNFESRIIRADNQIRWIRASGKLCLNTKGNPERMVGIVMDITEKKTYDEKIRTHMEELQRWENVMLDREDRVQELKCEINSLCHQLGQPVRYSSQEEKS